MSISIHPCAVCVFIQLHQLKVSRGWIPCLPWRQLCLPPSGHPGGRPGDGRMVDLRTPPPLVIGLYLAASSAVHAYKPILQWALTRILASSR